MIFHLFCHDESCLFFSLFHHASTVAAAWRMFSSVKAFEGQQYSALKKQCLQSGTLFEDPFFPAVDDSLFYQGNRIGRVHWKRPGVSCPRVSNIYCISTREKNLQLTEGLDFELLILKHVAFLKLSFSVHSWWTVFNLFSPHGVFPKDKEQWKSVWEMAACYMNHLIHVHIWDHPRKSITHLIKLFDLLLWVSEEGVLRKGSH